jgi:hypothetical protein
LIPSFTRRTYATESAAPKPRGRPAGSIKADKTSAKKTSAKKPTTGAKKKSPKKKKRTPARKKTAAAKPRKKQKKILTAEQKEQLKATKRAKAEVEKRKATKAACLSPPKELPSSAYTVLLVEMSKAAHKLQGAEAAARYKSLSPSELEVIRNLP